jgi:hypothetical protein
VGAIVAKLMESQTAVPGLPDWFYVERVEQLIDCGSLTIIEERDLLLQCKVQASSV